MLCSKPVTVRSVAGIETDDEMIPVVIVTVTVEWGEILLTWPVT